MQLQNIACNINFKEVSQPCLKVALVQYMQHFSHIKIFFPNLVSYFYQRWAELLTVQKAEKAGSHKCEKEQTSDDNLSCGLL